MFPNVVYKTEAWARGRCHYYEDDTLEIAINQYDHHMESKGKLHVLIAINGVLKYNDYAPFGEWEKAEAWAIEKARELYV